MIRGVLLNPKNPPESQVTGGLGIQKNHAQNKLITLLELQTTSFLWLFQLDDSKSLHKKWLFHQTSVKIWLFRVPG